MIICIDSFESWVQMVGYSMVLKYQGQGFESHRSQTCKNRDLCEENIKKL